MKITMTKEQLIQYYSDKAVNFNRESVDLILKVQANQLEKLGNNIGKEIDEVIDKSIGLFLGDLVYGFDRIITDDEEDWT